jgi:hypothetical protein
MEPALTPALIATFFFSITYGGIKYLQLTLPAATYREK